MNLVRRTAIALATGVFALGGGLTSFVQAAPQVGTVMASSPFELRGARVTTTGVPSWPVSAGDEVVTEDSPVSFQFPDGSQITLEPNSRARIEGTKKNPIFRLIDCTADYRLKRLNSVMLYRNDQVERISKLEGQYTVGLQGSGGRGCCRYGGRWRSCGRSGFSGRCHRWRRFGRCGKRCRRRSLRHRGNCGDRLRGHHRRQCGCGRRRCHQRRRCQRDECGNARTAQLQQLVVHALAESFASRRRTGRRSGLKGRSAPGRVELEHLCNRIGGTCKPHGVPRARAIREATGGSGRYLNNVRLLDNLHPVCAARMGGTANGSAAPGTGFSSQPHACRDRPCRGDDVVDPSFHCAGPHLSIAS